MNILLQNLRYRLPFSSCVKICLTADPGNGTCASTILSFFADCHDPEQIHGCDSAKTTVKSAPVPPPRKFENSFCEANTLRNVSSFVAPLNIHLQFGRDRLVSAEIQT
jgi:hypothetical protein